MKVSDKWIELKKFMPVVVKLLKWKVGYGKGEMQVNLMVGENYPENYYMWKNLQIQYQIANTLLTFQVVIIHEPSWQWSNLFNKMKILTSVSSELFFFLLSFGFWIILHSALIIIISMKFDQIIFRWNIFMLIIITMWSDNLSFIFLNIE